MNTENLSSENENGNNANTVLAADFISKHEAILKSLETFSNIIEMNKHRQIKVKFVEEQDFLNAANAREKEKEYQDKLPSIEIIEATLKIAMS
jgi:hypothetical protein